MPRVEPTLKVDNNLCVTTPIPWLICTKCADTRALKFITSVGQYLGWMIVQDILNGGSETSATTVEWAMAELISHPGSMKRAQDELELVVGADRLVAESDLPNLPYLQAVIKEVYRMHPALPLALPRESTKPSKVLGYNLPARTQLILNLAAIHRDPSVYAHPDTFDPERFVDHHLEEVNPTSGFDSYELIPFSAGRRMCPAFNLGHLTVSLLLAHLLHSFDWALPHGESAETYDMSETFGLTVHRKIPVSLIAHPKRPAYLY